MSLQPIENSFVSARSGTVNGVSGRLVGEFEDLQPGLRFAVFLEIRNHSFAPVPVSNLPAIGAELYDTAQQTVSTSGFSVDGPSPTLQWAVIPRHAYVGLRVDMQNAGIPAREHRRVFLGLGGKAWELSTGKYVLEATATFTLEESGPSNQWIGELQLPPVDVFVTDEMFRE